jgi:hypothetical protein
MFTDGFESCIFGTDTFVLFSSNKNIEGTFANVMPNERLNTSDGFGSFKVNYGPSSSFGPATIVLSNFISHSTSSPELGQFAAWTSSMGLPSDMAGTADDPVKDDLANELEYALGLNPNQVNPGQWDSLPIIIQNSETDPRAELHFRIVHPQPPDLMLEVEATSDPSGAWHRIAWKTGPGVWCGAQAVLGSPDSGQIPVIITDTQPISSAPQRFLRLRVAITQP